MKVAVIGATGLVGDVFLRVLEERSFPVSVLFPYASKISAGVEIMFNGDAYNVRTLEEENIEKCDLALFSSGSEIALKWAKVFADKGALVVDNSSAFRADPDIPLVIPEVNSEILKNYNGIVANPNCSTIGMVMALYPLHLKYELKSIIVTSFQSVSGAGRQAVYELELQNGDFVKEAKVFTRQIRANCIPQIGDILADGETAEEKKFRVESRKIMNIPDLEVSATAVRVPVVIGHSLSIHAVFSKKVTPEQAIDILNRRPGIKVYPRGDEFPTSQDATGNDLTHVGRIRNAQGFKNVLNMWVVLDNLRKGAATNAIQIAEKVLIEDSGLIS